MLWSWEAPGWWGKLERAPVAAGRDLREQEGMEQPGWSPGGESQVGRDGHYLFLKVRILAAWRACPMTLR